MRLRSNGKKILVFSDPHQEVDKLDRIIAAENADINVCLGDWFDSFIYDSDDDCSRTTNFLADFLSKPNNYSLWGNHDVHYFFKSSLIKCSGYERRKWHIINQVLGKKKTSVTNKFQWHIWIEDFLCTHAGLHPLVIPAYCTLEGRCLQEYLDDESKMITNQIKAQVPYWAYNAGLSRGGSQRVGGLIWLDFDEEFQPIDGLKQMVGHTFRFRTQRVETHRSENVDDLTKANNICIDTGLNQYVTFTNGKMEIKNYIDL